MSTSTQRVHHESPAEAEGEAARWLAYLVDHGRYEWERVEPLQLKAQPTPNLPCRLLGISGENPNGGYSPLFMLMAGKRRRRRYWQYITREAASGEIRLPQQALEDIEWVVDALVLSADLPPPPDADSSPLLISGRMLVEPTPFDEFTVDALLTETEDALNDLGSEIDVDAFLTVLEELAYNAIQHSGKNGGLFALDLVDDQLVGRVEDSGVGIKSTMSRNYPDISEEDALLRAFAGGGTSTGFSGRGGGLYLTLRYTMQVLGCLISLFTNEVAYMGLDGEGKVVASSGFSHQGVLVEVMVPLPRADQSL